MALRLPFPSNRPDVRLRHVDKLYLYFAALPSCRGHEREKPRDTRMSGGVPARFGRLGVQPALRYDMNLS
jgi:hypothetical protein